MNRQRLEQARQIGDSVGTGLASGIIATTEALSKTHKTLHKRYGGKLIAMYMLIALIIAVAISPAPEVAGPVVAGQTMPTPLPLVLPARIQLKEFDCPYKEIFIREGKRVDIPWQLLAATAKYESSFDPKAVSKDGYYSRGLGQFIKSTWFHVTKGTGWTWDDAFDPAKNIWAMATYYNSLRKQVYKPGLTEKQIVYRMVLAYTWGPSNVIKYGTKAPAYKIRHTERILRYCGYLP